MNKMDNKILAQMFVTQLVCNTVRGISSGCSVLSCDDKVKLEEVKNILNSTTFSESFGIKDNKISYEGPELHIPYLLKAIQNGVTTKKPDHNDVLEKIKAFDTSVTARAA